MTSSYIISLGIVTLGDCHSTMDLENCGKIDVPDERISADAPAEWR